MDYEKKFNKMIEKSVKEEKVAKIARLDYRIWLPKKKKMLLSHQHDIAFMDRMEGTFIAYDDIWDAKWKDGAYYYGNRYLLGVDAFYMPSMGRADKNGKKIFDGDIGKHPAGYIQTITCEMDTWTGDGFFIGYDFGSVTSDQWEILGNIHQHPHLLEEGKNTND